MFLCVLDRNGARTAAPRDFCTRVSTPVYAQAHADAPRPRVARVAGVPRLSFVSTLERGRGTGELSRGSLARPPATARRHTGHGTVANSDNTIVNYKNEQATHATTAQQFLHMCLLPLRDQVTQAPSAT